MRDEPHAPLRITACWAGTEVEISGDTSALAELAALLAAGTETRRALHVPAGSAHPYTAFLKTIAIGPAEGKILLTREDDELVIRGAPQHLRLLGENVETLLGPEGEGEHLHVEHHEGHFYLAEGSIALVVAARPA